MQMRECFQLEYQTLFVHFDDIVCVAFDVRDDRDVSAYFGDH